MENSNPQATQKKKGKKKWIIIAIVIILFIGIASSGSSESTDETPNSDTSTSQNEKESKTTKVTEASTTEPSTDNIKPGATVSNKTVKITYKKCDADFVDYSQYASIKDGHKVIQAIFDFENLSTSDIYLNGFDCYADGTKCESFYYVDDYSDPILTSISSGRKLTDATVYFEVPSDAETIELEYEANSWSGEKFIFIVE